MQAPETSSLGNPFRLGLEDRRVAEPCVFVILGAAGDLARRKLLPALFRLHSASVLPRSFEVVAMASAAMSTQSYREWASEIVGAGSTSGIHDPNLAAFLRKLHYVRRTSDLSRSFQALHDKLDAIAQRMDEVPQIVCYFAVPSEVVLEYIGRLGETGLLTDRAGRQTRLVVEKPFGSNLDDYLKLNQSLLGCCHETQLYRIDHYLGKETAQNILVLRFANTFFEPLLNSQYVDHIQITVAETIGVESRGSYYDRYGALRDMVQNHILQLLALLCLDAPESLNADSIRDAKGKLLRNVTCCGTGDVVCGQYGAGVLPGGYVKRYLEEDKVDPHSITETYAAMKVNINNDRWRGVPVFVRTGKRLAKRVSQIALQFKAPTCSHCFAGLDIADDVLIINIQPDEGVSVWFNAKVPGFVLSSAPVRMRFDYGSGFSHSVPDAYERLILDAIAADPSLFLRSDAIEASWRVCQPVLDDWQRGGKRVYTYSPGSWGPREADALIGRDGREWRRL